MSLAALWTFLAVALPVVTSFLAPMSTVDLAYQLRAGAEIVDARASRRSIPGRSSRAANRGSTSSGAHRCCSTPSTPRRLDRPGAAPRGADRRWSSAGSSRSIRRAAARGADGGPADPGSPLSSPCRRSPCGRSCSAWSASSPSRGCCPIRRTTPRALWLAPVVVLVWANLHGSFFLGPVLIGLAWLQDLHDRDPGARRHALAASSRAPWPPA